MRSSRGLRFSSRSSFTPPESSRVAVHELRRTSDGSLVMPLEVADISLLLRDKAGKQVLLGLKGADGKLRKAVAC